MSTNPGQKVGEEGSGVNLSYATRATHITPDLERVKRYDEYPARLKKQKRSCLLWAVLFAGPMMSLIAKGHPYWAILPGLVVLWNLWQLLQLANADVATVYEEGHLIPAVITSLEPLQIVALAPMECSEDAPVCWGVQRWTVQALPDHPLREGERIPCTAMFAGPMPFAGVWVKFEAHPLCWATGDTALLEEAVQAIAEDEWATLTALLPKALEREDVDIDKNCAYFNEDLSPRGDLWEKPGEKEAEEESEDAEKSAEPAPEQPVLIMRDVCWAFYGGQYPTLEKFEEAVQGYNRDITGKPWDADEIVLRSREVIIGYSYWDEAGEDECEADFVLSADRGAFTAGELLFKIHNRVVERLENEDHHFFEGLSLNDPHKEHPGLPFYSVNQGS